MDEEISPENIALEETVPLVPGSGETNHPNEVILDSPEEIGFHLNCPEPTHSSLSTEHTEYENESEFPLHKAVQDGDHGALKNLLEFKSDDSLYELNNEGKSALHVAVEMNNVKCFETLVRKLPVTLVNKDKDHNTPVHYIAKYGYEDIFNIAMQYKSNVNWNIMNKKHERPIHIAASENKKQILELLVHNGAKFDQKNKNGYTPLHYACDNGNNDCVKTIMEIIKDHESKNSMVNAKSKSKSTPLIMAAKKGFTECCTTLGEVEVDHQDNIKNTALHYAVRNGYSDIVRHLLKLKARIDITDDKGQTVLHIAVTKSNETILDLLLPMSNIDDETAIRLLESICKKNMVSCFQILREKRSIDHLINNDINGSTFLHLSLKKESYKIARLLIEIGAKRDIKDNNNDYPLHLAARLKKSSNRIEEEERIEVCKMILLNSHGLVHEVNKKNETPLHLAANSGNTEMIRSLISKGAKVMVKDNEDLTVVHIASKAGHEEALKRILKEAHGTNKRELNNSKPHPLHLAAGNGHLECCKIIQKHFKMRTLALADLDGKFPVDRAHTSEKIETFRYLLSNMKFEPKLEEFSCRLHKYCEDGCKTENLQVIEAVINSPWFKVVCDSFYCANGRKEYSEPTKCLTFETLSKLSAELSCKFMDRMISDSKDLEVHHYAPFEYIYYNKTKSSKYSSPFESSDGNNKLKSTSKELDGVMFGEHHPLQEISKTDDHRVLTHKLTK